jgi:hypothetical protein
LEGILCFFEALAILKFDNSHIKNIPGGGSPMETKQAIMAFSQSEKIKSGLIWVSHSLEMLSGLPEPEKQGGEKMIKAIINMIVHEIRLAGTLVEDAPWKEIESGIEQAIVMINSGVGSDAVPQLTRALSRVTTIGHRAMAFLKEKGLLTILGRFL